jgi:hypothetical protein
VALRAVALGDRGPAAAFQPALIGEVQWLSAADPRRLASLRCPAQRGAAATKAGGGSSARGTAAAVSASAPPSARAASTSSEAEAIAAAAAAAAAEERAAHVLAMSSVGVRPGESSTAADAPSSHVLGALVDLIKDSALGPQDPTVPRMPPFPLGIVLLGKPFAGKASLAARTVRRYALAVLKLDELVAQETAAAEQESGIRGGRGRRERVAGRARALVAGRGRRRVGRTRRGARAARAIVRAKAHARLGGWIPSSASRSTRRLLPRCSRPCSADSCCRR